MPRLSPRWLMSGLVATLIAAGLTACATVTTHHPVAVSELGQASLTSRLEASLQRPGAVTFERIRFASWIAGRGTLIDRDDPRTLSIPEGTEEVVIYAYVVDHPQFGRFMIDAGVSAQLPARVNWVMRRALANLNVQVDRTTGEWLAGRPAPRGVFLTHLHFDHIGGLLDIAPSTPVYLGPGEAGERNRYNALLGHPADAILRGYGPLREWPFLPDPDGRFDGLVDILGDGSIWAIHAPGHTAGSTAYLVNATDGPKLIVGDAASTDLVWEAGMPQPLPDEAQRRAERSRLQLRAFAAAHPRIKVFLGHQ